MGPVYLSSVYEKSKYSSNNLIGSASPRMFQYPKINEESILFNLDKKKFLKLLFIGFFPYMQKKNFMKN